jgi:aspartokinase
MENIKISSGKSLLFLIGQNLWASKQALAEAILLLEKNGIWVDLTNDAAYNRGYILWVNSKDELKAVRLLHKHFIETKNSFLTRFIKKFLGKIIKFF